MTLFFSNSRIQLLDSSYVYSLDITHKAKNYKLGITVQSALIAVFCLLAISHEIMAVCSKTFLPFMEKEMSRAITHILIACFSLGFCGGIGIICSIIELAFALICYITAIIEAWNPSTNEPPEYEQSTT